MAVTRSSASERRQQAAAVRQSVARPFEFVALLLASVVIAGGLALVYRAQAGAIAQLDPQTINLNTLERREQLMPLLGFAPNAREREFLASRIWETVQRGDLPNVGALGRIPGRDGAHRLLTMAQVAEIKSKAVVRTPGDFRNAFLLWAALYFAFFYVLHFFWRMRGFPGEQAILPPIHLLTGAGFALMVALRDPLRDTSSFVDFSQSVGLGVVAMAALSQLDYDRMFGRLSYLPLLAAVAVSIVLVLFGTGPGTSDAKVNLLGFQPVELIKILIAFFLAGYFASRWEFLRVLRERRPELDAVSRHVEIPRLEYLLPVLLGVVLTLVFFFVQKDLGPALVISCVFLAMYAVARGRATLALTGLAVMLGGFLIGFLLGYPRTVHARVSMWLSPWDNAVRGGEQVVHALWAFATGGLFGTGPGLGDPEIMPAAHTDLILAALGEEWGFAGVLAALLLYALLVWLGLRIAMRARNDYSMFLALALTFLIAISTALIAGGVLDLLPLSGVVTPFLSYGGTAMIANFAVFAILLSLSRDTNPDPEQVRPFRLPVRRVAQVLGGVALVLIAKAAWVQIVRADATAGAGVLALQADGFRRYQYNPRLVAIANSIPRGTVFDRNGLPVATSDQALIDAHREEFQRAGIDVARTVNRKDDRHYPLGAAGFHVLGDLRTRANWGAPNSSLIERDSMVRLQGFDDRARVVEVEHPATGKPTYTVQRDFRELLPLLRHRHQPDHPAVLAVMNRDRDVRTTIDSRLQLRAARILEAGLKRLRKQKGAAVVIDPATGDLLANVSYPLPEMMPPELGPDGSADTLLDRARYGLYPPGSTFKIVTAMAALRKDPKSADLEYGCRALGDGRIGNHVKGWGRPVRDDVADKIPHGNVNMRRGIVVSCNAYFAQLAVYNVKADALKETAGLLGIATGDVEDALPQVGYGQGQVVASPFQMARAAATVASKGEMPYGRWIMDESNPRVEPPAAILPPPSAAMLAEYMRGVVTNGTGRSVANAPVAIAGKTGTAEVENKASHAWFVGFAPYGAPKIAFAVIVEHGQYGGSAAAPIARDIVAAASELGLLSNQQ